MTEVVEEIPAFPRRMEFSRRLTSSQENVVISSASSIRNRGKRSRSVSVLTTSKKRSLDQDLHVMESSAACVAGSFREPEREMDCGVEVRALWHWLRQVEKYLYSESWAEDSGKDENLQRQDLEHHLIVHGTIEKLVSRLNQTKEDIGQRNLTALPADWHIRLRHLETRLHQCWLKSLERQFRLEEDIQLNQQISQLTENLRDTDSDSRSASSVCLCEPPVKCFGWSDSELDCVHQERQLAVMSGEKGVMAGAAGQGIGSLRLALNLPGGKVEVVSQDIGYASESSTLNLSMDDVSPSQPVAPALAAVSAVVPSLFPSSPGRLTPAASAHSAAPAHSDTDSSRKTDARKLRLPLDPAIRNGSLRASPNEFYYKVAPLILDARAEVLTRSARGSLSRLRGGPALAFTDDEGESTHFRTLDTSSDVVVDPPIPPSTPPTNPSRTLRARTLPPEDRTALLASQCTPAKSDPVRRKPRRRRPWSLHLHDTPPGVSPGVSASVSESALASQLFPGTLGRGRRRGVVVDWSGTSSEEGDGEEEELDGSRGTVCGGRGGKGKSVSLWMLNRRKRASGGTAGGEGESSCWDDYQDPPYSSEAYSEKSVDESLVQQITSFGDDFWTIFPTGSSAFSTDGRNLSESALDSDGCESSAEELRNVLNESLRQFHIAQTAFRASGNRGRNRCVQLKEIRATCQTNLAWLTTIGKHLGGGGEGKENGELVGEGAFIQDLIERWDGLCADVMGSEACSQWLRSTVASLRDLQGVHVLLSHTFNPKHPSPLLIRSVQACATIQQQIQTKLSTVESSQSSCSRLITQIQSHLSTCTLCSPSTCSLLSDAESLSHHLTTLSVLGRRSLEETAQYQRLLESVRTRLTGLQGALTSSLPDLVPVDTGERDVMGEWSEVERMLGEMKGMGRFILLDGQVGEMVKEVKGMLGERDYERRIPLTTTSRESVSLPEHIPLILEKPVVESQSTLPMVYAARPKRNAMPNVKKDLLASKFHRTCLLSAPLAGLVIFLCLLAGAFLFQPHCCSFTTQKSLFTITLDYPHGSPPI